MEYRGRGFRHRSRTAACDTRFVALVVVMVALRARSLTAGVHAKAKTEMLIAGRQCKLGRSQRTDRRARAIFRSGSNTAFHAHLNQSRCRRD
jgi:hypothetical protein